jgi:hypothetical protein
MGNTVPRIIENRPDGRRFHFLLLTPLSSFWSKTGLKSQKVKLFRTIFINYILSATANTPSVSLAARLSKIRSACGVVRTLYFAGTLAFLAGGGSMMGRDHKQGRVNCLVFRGLCLQTAGAVSKAQST